MTSGGADYRPYWATFASRCVLLPDSTTYTSKTLHQGIKAVHRLLQVIVSYVLGLCGLGVYIYFWGKADDLRRAQLAAELEQKAKSN